MKADIDLDIRRKTFASGLLPELIAVLQRSRPGDLVAVVGDEESLGPELETWCRFTGNSLLEATLEKGRPRWVFRCGTVAQPAEDNRPAGCGAAQRLTPAKAQTRKSFVEYPDRCQPSSDWCILQRRRGPVPAERQLRSEARRIRPSTVPTNLSDAHCAFTQVSDPTNLTATLLKKIWAGVPSAVSRWSVETSSGPAFL